MSSLWSRWVGLCTEREHGRSQALFRIALGAVVVGDTAGMLRSGIISVLYLSATDGGLSPRTKLFWLVDVLGGHQIGVVHGLFGAALALSVALTVGLGGRWTALALLQVELAVRSLSHHTSGGYDLVISNGLWLLVLSSCTATLSADCRLRTGAWTSDRLIYAFPRYLAVFQLVLMYTATGLNKRGFGWSWPYDGLHYSLQRVGYPRFDLPWLGDVAWATRIGTAVTWYWETFFGVLGLWFVALRGWAGVRAQDLARRYDFRIPWLGTGVGLHVGIWATMVLGPFSWVTLAFYFAFLEPPRADGG
jgi:hypothetical protein